MPSDQHLESIVSSDRPRTSPTELSEITRLVNNLRETHRWHGQLLENLAQHLAKLNQPPQQPKP